MYGIRLLPRLRETRVFVVDKRRRPHDTVSTLMMRARARVQYRYKRRLPGARDPPLA